MLRSAVPYTHQLSKTLATMSSPGLLLGATKPSGESNVMTIGWGVVGIIWRRPIFQVMVRPSRHTYEFINESGVFTVNVPAESMRDWVGFCGSNSGRDLDKFAAHGVQTSMGHHVPVVTMDECPMVYECKVVYTDDVIPANLDVEAEASCYGGSDYHRIYYGEILGVYASGDY